MAARPRKYQRNVDNLYQKTDKRNGKTYFTYRHPETGKFIGLGSDQEKAFAAAAEANRLFAERQLEQYQILLDHNPVKVSQKGVSAKAWIDRYTSLQKERRQQGELKPTTLTNKLHRARLFAERFGNKGMKEITTKDIVDVLDEYKEKNKIGMAQSIRSIWKDIFLEAQYAGIVDSGFNPVATTREIRRTTQRKRINEADIREIMTTKAYKSRHYLQMAVKLAITTGLRREDIANLKFNNIKNGYLFVSTSKSNGKTNLAFPLELSNPFLNESLGEIIAECRSTRIVSRFLVHHTKKGRGNNTADKGDQVPVNTISSTFLDARKESSVATKNFSFHELRSFAERTYREAGFDTKTLLGHSSQTTTDMYNNDREQQYTYIQLPKTS